MANSWAWELLYENRLIIFFYGETSYTLSKMTGLHNICSCKQYVHSLFLSLCLFLVLFMKLSTSMGWQNCWRFWAGEFLCCLSCLLFLECLCHSHKYANYIIAVNYHNCIIGVSYREDIWGYPDYVSIWSFQGLVQAIRKVLLYHPHCVANPQGHLFWQNLKETISRVFMRFFSKQ